MHPSPRPSMTWRKTALSLAAALLTPFAACAQGPASDQLPVMLDVPYVPTPNEAVYRMLELAEVQPDDYLIDLGSGDGRIVIAAARDWGVRKALGIDIDPERIEEANENAKFAKVSERVTFERGNLFEKDFSDVDVLTMYLLPTINLELRPVILDKLRPGTRIVSHVFDMGDWRPDAWIEVQSRYIYKWIVPAKVQGSWEVTRADGSSFRIDLKQNYQFVKGEADYGTQTKPISYASLRGAEFRFSANGKHFTGRVEGDRMTALPGTKVIEGWHAKRL
ncbi:MAG: class I SAM-dependent methyltransferase [Zoogloeaceae bacterium]|nr:class I SAM-dependent methyltransferase [Zoogloeaceae bacterium]